MKTAITKTPAQVSPAKSDKKTRDALIWAATHEGIIDPSKQLVKCDFRDSGEPWEKRREYGKSLREKTHRKLNLRKKHLPRWTRHNLPRSRKLQQTTHAKLSNNWGHPATGGSKR